MTSMNTSIPSIRSNNMSRHDYGTTAAIIGSLAVLIGITAVMYGKRRGAARPVESSDTRFARGVQQEARELLKGMHTR
jgi:hypothetical protein